MEVRSTTCLSKQDEDKHDKVRWLRLSLKKATVTATIVDGNKDATSSGHSG